MCSVRALATLWSYARLCHGWVEFFEYDDCCILSNDQGGLDTLPLCHSGGVELLEYDECCILSYSQGGLDTLLLTHSGGGVGGGYVNSIIVPYFLITKEAWILSY